MSDAERRFRTLSADLLADLRSSEVLLLNHVGEDTHFLRLNRNQVRNAGHVHQESLRVELIDAERAAMATVPLSGHRDGDLAQAREVLDRLRAQLSHLPPDPFLHFATERCDTRHCSDGRLPPAQDAAEDLIAAGGDLDLVGSLAWGEMTFGFANSLGQFNWHSDDSFHADWSVHGDDRGAVKQSYSGFAWEREFVAGKLAYARDTLGLLQRTPKVLSPGRYRAFLEPTALNGLLQIVGSEGFGLKSHRTAQSPLLRMSRDGVRLNEQVSLVENHAGGRTPRFNQAGFIKPEEVELVRDGVYGAALADPRSAKEYGEAVNCANEHPESLEMAGGALHQDHILDTLDTGIYLSDLWYCNLSDRSRCRITGMTRFACLWVEHGEPVAPINVMRFDESMYFVLGDGLVALTEEHERIFDTTTYERRSEASAMVPGALVDGFRFTL